MKEKNRQLSLIFILAFELLLFIQNADASMNRHALVIGNGAYTEPMSPLVNPVNDAKDVASALRGLGFEVTHLENLSAASMNRKVREFSKRLSDTKGVGLFYYAGHGVEVNGRNYLIPVGMKADDEDDLEYAAYDASRILSRMEGANNHLNIVIIDACRDNPYDRLRSIGNTRGLQKMVAPLGSIVASSTASGTAAYDGKEGERNSPYTKELLEHISTPGLSLEEIFKRVRKGVTESTNERQIPWESTSLTDEFYFMPQIVAKDLDERKTAADVEERYWLEMKECGTQGCFQSYLNKYPNGDYSAAAAARMSTKEGSMLIEDSTPKSEDRLTLSNEPIIQSNKKRVALVVGNSSYRKVHPLPNSRTDARLIRDKLESLDFDVSFVSDLDVPGMLGAISDFRRRLKTADVGLFYYIGHAIQVESENFMMPVDIEIDIDQIEINHEAINLDYVYRAMFLAPTSVNIVILDACRDNPFQITHSYSGELGSSTSIDKGLSAPRQFKKGMYIAYATGPGQVSYEGKERSGSPFSAALARHITRPGLSLEQLFTEVRNDVIKETKGRQIPWNNTSLTQQFYIAGEQVVEEMK